MAVTMAKSVCVHAWASATVLSVGVVLAGATASADEPPSASSPSKDECISANESAQDLQTAGKLRDAKGKLTICMAATCPGPLRQDCTQRLATVEAAIPTLVLVAKDATGRDVTGVRVTMDGHVLVESLGGAALAVDPGEHKFYFEAAGLPLAEKTIVLRAGEKDRREFVVFSAALPPGAVAAAAPTAAPPTAPAAAPTGTPLATAPAPASQASDAQPAEAVRDGSTQRMIGLVLGGAGAVGLVLGGVFGVMTKSTYDHALGSECGSAAGYTNAMACTPAGVQDVRASHDQATLSTVSFVVGAALLGGGAYLYFTAPKATKVGVSPLVGPTGAGLRLGGTW
jgi:hypothetical protein